MPPAATNPGRGEGWAGVRQGVLIGAAVLAIALPPSRPLRAPATAAVGATPSAVVAVRRGADFRGHPASVDARHMADWVARTGDQGGKPFVILDKRDARVYVFDRAAVLVDESPVLLGFAAGDESVDGIGSRPLEQVGAHEKTTAAGRFEAERGHDSTGEDVVWIDYDASVAMHRVRVVDPKERRFERLRSPNPADRRISFGCVNVPVAFFENVVAPVFRKAHAMVYVLPDTKSLRDVFGAGVGAARGSG